MTGGAIGGGGGRGEISIGAGIDEESETLRTNLWVWDTDAVEWVRMTQPEATSSGTGIPSNPPEGHYKITNMYINSQTGKLVVEYDDTPA